MYKKKKRVSALTLGCKLNYAETSAILDNFVRAGWGIADNDTNPDLVIIHTCAVTAQAEKKSRQQIRKMVQKYPQSRIAVTGCYAQLSPDDIEKIDGVDVILGTKEKFAAQKYITAGNEKIYREISPPETITEASPAHSFVSGKEWGRTRAFLKIQDGCDYGCSYCTIPLARGKSCSVPLEKVIEGAGRLAEAGYREIVLTGINIADYRNGSDGLVELLEELESVDVGRIRISSVEPDVLSDRLIDRVATSSKIMPHFHLPLQSGSDAILSAMHRRYTASGYSERLHKAVETIQDCAVGADVMIGYPGETEDDFRSTCELLESLPVAYLHVFTCSIRQGTSLAAEVTAGIRQRTLSETARARSGMLLELAGKKQREFTRQYAGRELDVLFEDQQVVEGGLTKISGYSRNYLRVQVITKDNLTARDLVGREEKVYIESMSDDLILGGRFVT